MDPSDEVLFKLVLDADEEELRAGKNPKQRSISTGMRVARQLGIVYSIGGQDHPVIARINRIIDRLYRVEDLALGALHMGMFMFRDIFAQVNIPIVFGSGVINPLKQTNLNDAQLQWLCSRPNDLQCFLDQFSDLFDLALGTDDLSKMRQGDDECRKFIDLARFQLEGAAAIATTAYDFRGAIQCALIGAELALKGGLASHGLTEDELRGKYGHRLKALAEALVSREPKLDANRVVSTVSKFPEYAKNRYAKDQPSRQETGHIIMGAQYVAAEVVRQLTDRNSRGGWQDPKPRIYPM